MEYGNLRSSAKLGLLADLIIEAMMAWGRKSSLEATGVIMET